MNDTTELLGSSFNSINPNYPSTSTRHDVNDDSECVDDLIKEEHNYVQKYDSQDGSWSSNGLNPFVHRLEIDDKFELAKIYTLSVLLLPLRVFGAVLSILTAWVFAYITLYGLTMDDLKNKPLTGWRRIAQKAVAKTMRLVYASCSFHHIKYIGKQASPKEAPILVVAPHSSYVDSVLVVVTGPTSVVAKRGTSDIPILGKIISCAQPIYVEREDPNSRQNTIREIIARAKSDDDWQQVVIFSEGTCTNRTALIKFKPGAFYPGVPVQPVLLKYPNKYDTYTWTWDGPGVLKLLWLTLAKIYSRCEIEFLPVYTPNEEEKTNPKLFADNVQALMAKALNVPVSDYSFEDCIMMNRAKEMKIPFPGDIVAIEKCLYLLGILHQDINKKLASKYCNLPGDDSIDFITFADLLNIDLSNKVLCELFRILDHNQCGTISLRNYLLCLFYCEIKDERLIEFLSNIINLYTPSSLNISRECFNKIVRHSAMMTEEQSDALFLSIDHTNKGTISFDEFKEYTKDKPKYAFLYKKQELIRRSWK
ncbi:lysophosphatidylcholine acyltransferase [Episyrphus balteatus]|uniref:lysophosphatidylcholine acyltransferase n=1 Tax=Episyrphus balteatus TaxID=286459 RepID=UPI0024856835|nr:lysophosphatidylcholine acyltransferase [Episyrphus balteatus]